MTSVMKYSLGGVVAVALLGGALAMGVATQDNGKLAPGLRVGGVDVGGLTVDQASALIAQKNPVPQVTVSTPLTDTVSTTNAATPAASAPANAPKAKTWTVPADSLGWRVSATDSLKAAEKFTAERTLLERIQGAMGKAEAQDFPVTVSVDQAAAKAGLDKLTAGLGNQPKSGAVGFDNKSLRYAITTPAVPGRKPDTEAAAKAFAANPKQSTLNIPVTEWQAAQTNAQLQAVVDRGNALMRPMTVKLDGTNHVGGLTALQLANFYWVKPEGIVLDKAAIQKSFKGMLSVIDEPAKNARYAWQGGKYVKVAEKAGHVTDEAAAMALFEKAILDPAAKSITFPSKESQPALTLANLPDPAKMVLISTGVSTYYHSSPARRTNVANAAAKIDGAVVGPGEVFSFLSNLGGISPANGFVGGLIISGGRTVDGLGGGVCQVSTTTFRAMYQAGLPVVERNQHSYRVGYYEPQVGFEAAVYDPGVDLKFKNDTGGTIMLKTTNYPNRSRLVIEVWGTVKPQRTVAISPAVILSRTAHPAPKYVVSNKLRPGQMNQVDWAQDGYNLYITRTIKDASGTRYDRTSTFYKPWQAVFEVGPGTLGARTGNRS